MKENFIFIGITRGGPLWFRGDLIPCDITFKFDY